MTRVRFLVLLIAALVLANCAPNADDDLSADWCYTFAFNEGLQGFNLATGSLSAGQGLLTDGSGLLQFSYAYDRFIQPKYVLITVARPVGVHGNINANVAGEIFGIRGGFTGTLGTYETEHVGTQDINSATVLLEPSEIGIAGKNVNVSLEADQPLLIRSIEVKGDGANPFDRNECDYDNPLNPTPSATPIGTPSATMTASSTSTSTATVTGTAPATATPVCSAGTDINLVVNKTATSPGVVLDAGTSDNLQYPSQYLTYETGEGFTYTFSSGTYISGVTIAIARFSVNTGVKFYINGVLVLTSVPDASHPTNGSAFSVPLPIDPIFMSAGETLRVEQYESASPASPVLMYPVIIEVLNCNTPTPTPTPTASNTPNETQATQTASHNQTATAAASITPTSTPSDRYVCVYNFLDSANGFTAVNLGDGPRAIYNEGSGWQGLQFAPNLYTWVEKTITSTNIASITLTWVITVPVAHLSIEEPYKYSVNVDAGTRLQKYTSNKSNVTYLLFTGEGGYVSGKQITLQRAVITGNGVPPSGASCQEPTATPAVSRTPIATTTPRPSTRTPVPPPPQFVTPTYITATPGGPTLTPGGITITPYGTPVTGAGQTGQGLGSGVGVGTGTGSLFGDWLGQANGFGLGLVSDFIDAQPEPIPGLPLCMSNPLQHDICAIYYILDYTLLADGTPGELIVPFALLIINVYIILYFLRWVLRIVRRGESVTSVG